MMRDHNKSTTCTTIMKVRRHFLCIVRKYEGIMKVLSYIYCSPTCRATRKGLYEGTKVQHWYNVVVFSRTSALIA